MKETTNGISINFSFSRLCTMLFIVFLILKLCGVIAWSWWLVCLPLIISVGIVVLILLIALVLFIIGVILARKNY